MEGKLSLQRIGLIILVPIALLLAAVLIIQNVDLNSNSSLSIAFTIDLLLTIPLIYFILIRKTQIPKTTVVPILILGIIIGSIYLPESEKSLLNLFKVWALPLIEIGILSFVFIKIRKAVKEFRKVKDDSIDVFETLKMAAAEILPKGIVIPFSTEIAVFYYGFLDWKTRKLNSHEYSYHQSNGTQTLYIAFILVICFETIGFHVLIAKWNETVAWVFTFLSIYTIFQLFGFSRSLSKRPYKLNDDELILTYGIMSEARIPLNKIVSVTLSSENLSKDKKGQKLSILGDIEGHNISIEVNEELSISKLYGFKRTYTHLAFHVDELSKFKEDLNEKLGLED